MINSDSNFTCGVIMINNKKIIILFLLLLIEQTGFSVYDSYGYVCDSPTDQVLLVASNNQAQAAIDDWKAQGTSDQISRLYLASGFTGNTSCAIGWYNRLVGLIDNCIYPGLVCDDHTQTIARLTVLADIANISDSLPLNAKSAIGSNFNQLYAQYLKIFGVN